MADLDYAIANMKTAKELGDHVHVSKNTALTIKARILANLCLGREEIEARVID